MNNSILKENYNFNWLKAFLLIPIFFLGTLAHAQNASCLSFDGDDHISVANAGINTIGSNDFTFEAVISGSFSTFSSHHIIFSTRANTNNGVTFFLHDVWGGSAYKMLAVQIEGLNYVLLNNGTFNGNLLDGTCHHVAISRSSNLLSYFVDGLLIGTRPISSGASITGSSTLTIGKDLIVGSEFDGKISQVRVWDDVRSQSEINTNKDISIAGTSANLTHYWELDEGTGQIAIDKALNADGVFGGDTTIQTFDPTWGTNCCTGVNANITYNQGNYTSCNSAQYFLYSQVTGGVAPYTFVWNYNGQIYTGQYPMIEIFDYDPIVSVTITDSTGLTITDLVTIQVAPYQINVSSVILSETCDSTIIQYFANSTFTTTTWQWNVGSQTANIPNPIFAFANDGSTINTTLTSPFSFCPDTASHTFTLDSNYCNSTAGCDYSLTLNDSYGDGWNGNSLNMYINGVLINNYSFTSGYSQNFTVSLNTGDSVIFIWDDSGIYDYECSWTFTSQAGATIFNEVSLLNTNPVGPYVANCTPVFAAIITYTQANQMSCNSVEYFFAAQPTGGVAPYTYLWDYNGVSYTGPTPAIEIFDFNPIVSLVIVDASNTTITNQVSVIIAPSILDIGYSIFSQTCDSTFIQFNAISNIQSTSWLWNIGSLTSNIPNPVLGFANDGSTINVTLTSPFSFCQDTADLLIDLDTNTCATPTGCGHILTLDDSYGDGWNGNSLNAYVNGVFFNNYTFTFGSTQTFPISLNTGDYISFVWDNSGSWSYECSWSFTNASGNLVFDEASPLSTTNVGQHTAFCSDFNTLISSTLDTMINCTSAAYQFTATPNGGTAPYTYIWIYDGMTYTSEFPIITTNSANPTISVMVTDANGLVSNETFLVTTTEPLAISVSASTPTCDSTNYLYAYAYPTGGSGHYSYAWSNGVTDYSISSYSVGITLGSYSVIVTDTVTGCTVSATVNLYNDCFSVSGTVYVDYNGNCIVDGADHPFSSSYFVDLTGPNASWGDYDYVPTSNNGHYFIGNVSAGLYGLDVNGSNTNLYNQICPSASFTVLVDSTNPNPTVDIFMTPPTPIQDLSISMTSFYGVSPEHYDKVRTRYCNDGTIPMNGFVEINYDAQVNYAVYPYSNPLPNTVDAVNRLLTYNFVGLQPGQCRIINTYYNTPVTLPMGTHVEHTAVVEPISGDITPSNNLAYYFDTCTSSWDPNDKAVYPIGNISVNQKDHDYTIRFQNEGNGPATLVVVRDDLDDNLDIQTLRNVSASHNFVLTIENTDELVFTFNNIYLTPKDVDEPNSKGSIDFTISQKEDLPLGTVIQNTAEIYFDFNEAIITNTTINTIVEKTTGIKNVDELEVIEIYPNPSNGLFNVVLEDNNSIQTIEVFDVLGKLIFSAEDLSGSKAIVNLQNVSKGIYVMKVTSERGVASKSIVINK